LFPIAAIGLAVIVGIVIRVARLSECAVDHFDEGVYASMTTPDEQGRTAYPLRHLYAPPLVPCLQAISAWATGDMPEAAVLVGVLAGCATPLAIGWVGYRWFNPWAGAVSATLAATSDLHASFSRSALTDVPLLLFLVLALAALESAFRSGRTLSVLAAGALVGVCWWTKYNGWLPLAIGAVALILQWAADRRATRRHRPVPQSTPVQSTVTAGAASTATPSARSAAMSTKRAATHLPAMLCAKAPAKAGASEVPAWGAGLAVAAVAGIAFAAQLYLLSADGYRYADVAANHRRYVVGPAGWWDSLLRQAANQSWFEGGLTAVVGPLAILAWMLPRRRGFYAAIALATGIVTAGMFPALLGAAVVWLWLVARDGWRFPERVRWGTTLLVAWTAGLLVATPNYTPYARLALPLVAALWLVAGDLLARCAAELAAETTAPSTSTAPTSSTAFSTSTAPTPSATPTISTSSTTTAASDSPIASLVAVTRRLELGVLVRVAVLAVWLLVVAICGSRLWYQGMPAWRDRTDLRRAASRLVDRVLADSRDARSAVVSDAPQAVFLTYGEPAVFYLLAREPRFRVPTRLGIAPTGDIPRTLVVSCPVFLITGPHAGEDAPLRAAADRLTLIAEETFQLSDLPLLDLRDARTLPRAPASRSAVLRCYRLVTKNRDSADAAANRSSWTGTHRGVAPGPESPRRGAKPDRPARPERHRLG